VTAAVAAASPQRFYYGWKVLAALFMAGFMVYGGGLWPHAFVMPLIEEFHWTRAATGGLVTAFWLSAPMILLGGSGIKRFGAVRMLVCGILIEAACLPCSPPCRVSGRCTCCGGHGLGKVALR